MSFIKEVNIKDQLIILVDNDGRFLEFPIIWLRDNCQCLNCFHEPTNTRTIDWDNFNFNVEPRKVKVSYFESIIKFLLPFN